MEMRVDEAGNDGLAAELQLLRGGADECRHLTRLANGDKAAVPHGERIGGRLAPIHRDDVSVRHDQVSGFSSKEMACGQQG